MHSYINDLLYVIRTGAMENTYKMAWIRAIVEHCVTDPNSSTIHFDNLSRLIFGYYWNQTIFFDLEQSPNPHKRAIIHQMVQSAIETYQTQHGKIPVFFAKAEPDIHIQTSQISTVLSKDVCHRFPIVGKQTYDLYEFDLKARTITLPHTHLLREYSDLLFEVINYNWTQKLEFLNSAPRIAAKVRGVDREDIRRNSLSPFREYLDIENPNRICFISGAPIPEGDLSIDHVIPWSYLYSDDLWNLVYVSKTENSSKSNHIASEPQITQLEKRNERLLELMGQQGISNKRSEELKLAIEQDYVRKFWIGSKG